MSGFHATLHVSEIVNSSSRGMVWRTDADRIRELGRCQTCGSPREAVAFTYSTPSLDLRDAVAVVCTAEASHETRGRTKPDATFMPAVVAWGPLHA